MFVWEVNTGRLFFRSFVCVGSCLFVGCNIIVKSFTRSLVLHVSSVSQAMEQIHKRASDDSHGERGRRFFGVVK